MKFMKRVLVGLTFYFCCTAVVLLCVSLGTKFWIESNAFRNFSGIANVSLSTPVPEPGDTNRFEGSINLGLFEEYKDLNPGWGSRKSSLWIKGEYDRNAAFIDFKLWLATIIFLCLAILFGVVGAGFALTNAITTPIECITGVRGLYVWNTVAALFNLLCIIMWVLLYYTKFKDNVMSSEDLQNGWTSKDHARFGYSFWIVVGAMLLYIINLVIIFISSIEPEFQRRTNAVVNEKPADGVIMLF